MNYVQLVIIALQAHSSQTIQTIPVLQGHILIFITSHLLGSVQLAHQEKSALRELVVYRHHY